MPRNFNFQGLRRYCLQLYCMMCSPPMMLSFILESNHLVVCLIVVVVHAVVNTSIAAIAAEFD